MKKSYLRAGLALALALGLASCGGDDDGDLQLVVALSGVTKDGLTLRNNGGAEVPVAPGTVFVFPNLIPVDSEYNVTVGKEPDNVVPGSCKPNALAKGTATTVSPRGITLICEVQSFTLGGTISGQVGDVEINNGSFRKIIPANATSFNMTVTDDKGVPVSGKLPEGTPYAVTILNAPATQNCTVTSGTGTMPKADYLGVTISCVNK